MKGYLDPDPGEPHASDHPTLYCLGQASLAVAAVLGIFFLIGLGFLIYYASTGRH
jgi:hypothetical protein